MGITLCQAITKTLVSAAIAVGCCVASSAPAGADPDEGQVGSDPFASLWCDCRETSPTGSAAQRDEFRRGLREGLATALSGLPVLALGG